MAFQPKPEPKPKPKPEPEPEPEPEPKPEPKPKPKPEDEPGLDLDLGRFLQRVEKKIDRNLRIWFSAAAKFSSSDSRRNKPP